MTIPSSDTLNEELMYVDTYALIKERVSSHSEVVDDNVDGNVVTESIAPAGSPSYELIF